MFWQQYGIYICSNSWNVCVCMFYYSQCIAQTYLIQTLIAPTQPIQQTFFIMSPLFVDNILYNHIMGYKKILLDRLNVYHVGKGEMDYDAAKEATNAEISEMVDFNDLKKSKRQVVMKQASKSSKSKKQEKAKKSDTVKINQESVNFIFDIICQVKCFIISFMFCEFAFNIFLVLFLDSYVLNMLVKKMDSLIH